MHVLVIRLSAMGDVAMTVPVIMEALSQNPKLEITFLSRKPFQNFFPLSDRLHFVAMDTNGEYKGTRGIYKMYKQLNNDSKFTAVADFHNVLRSKVLSSFFKVSGVKVASIEKGRAEKKQLVKKGQAGFMQLKHSSLRYADVLRKLGLNLDFNPEKRKAYVSLKEEAPLALNKFNVGFAPFAQHLGKAFPFEKCKEAIAEIAKNKDVNVFLFGGGKKETELLGSLESDNVFSLAGKYNLKQELAQISKLNVMVSMDSANMHMASLFGIRTISVWGATHYFAGFMGIGQSKKDAIEISVEELDCRPCSIFGNKPCARKDYACLNYIESKAVSNKINDVLNR